jgi:ribosome biogenesis GTPase
VLHKVRKRQDAGEIEAHLVVGDWVAFEPRGEPTTALIHEILPRHSLFVRKAAGLRTEPQPMASNVDAAFIVIALDAEPNPRRTERFLTMVHRAGAEAVLVFTKIDLVEAPEERAIPQRAGAMESPFYLVSGETGAGVEALARSIGDRKTVALLGASGVGKSTLVNALFGQSMMSTGAVRGHDQRGRHTTTERQLLILPSGGLLIDGPGIREIEPWDAEEALLETFDDIAELAASCRFSDCGHDGEPGCAVRAAAEGGQMTEERWRAFVKLKAESRGQARKRRR